MRESPDQEDLRGRASPGGPLTLVLLCQALSELGNGLDLAEVCRWFQETDSAVEVEIVADLCKRPRALPRVAAVGAGRLVLGLCSGDYGELEMQARARKVGLDPLSVERVNLGEYCVLPHPGQPANDKAKLLLAAAVARSRAFPGSRPENVRPYFPRKHQKVSRRALFTLPPIGYRAVASIQSELCFSEAGCQLCVEVCPRGALAIVDGRVTLDRSSCLGCGLCVVECPGMAIHLPTHSPLQIEAEMTELLRNPAMDVSQPRAILFVCQRNAAVMESLGREGLSYPVGWLPVHVPCAGMVSAAWILQSFALGAAAVGVATCVGCPLGQRERIEGRTAYCRELLGLLGGSPGDVRILRYSSGAELADALGRPFENGFRHRHAVFQCASLSGPLATARALQNLSEEFGASETFSLAHPYSPLGIVEIEADKCTGCGACAQACPTGALAFEREESVVRLTFDPALCVGCGQCSGWCPERIMRVDTVTDLQRLRGGRASLYEDGAIPCEICGTLIVPAAMMRRIETLLSPGGGTSAMTIAAITRRCPSCRVPGTR